VPLIFYVVIC